MSGAFSKESRFHNMNYQPALSDFGLNVILALNLLEFLFNLLLYHVEITQLQQPMTF